MTTKIDKKSLVYASSFDNGLLKNRHAWLLLVLIMVAIGLTSWQLIDSLWSVSLLKLFKPSHLLTTYELSIQLQLVATSIVAILAGGLLGVTSILLQQLVKNPLASDTTLAVGTGAQLILLMATLFAPNLAIYGSDWLAFLGSLLSIAIVFILSAKSRFHPLILILAGLVINILLAAIAGTLVLFFTERSVGILSWSAGFLNQVNWHASIKLSITTLAVLMLCLPLLKPLLLMSLDNGQARRLGVPIHTIRFIVVIVVSVITALVVSEIGLIGFIGLAAASLVNALNITHIGQRLFASFIFGGLLLWLTSNATLLVEPLLGQPVPAGAITGLLGAPLIIWLTLRQRRESIVAIAPMLTNQRKHIHWYYWGALLIVLITVACLIVQDINGFGLSFDWAITQLYRMPRTLSAAATGVMLAVAGVLLQTLTRNPMASPEVLGISSGAALGVILGFVLLPLLGMSAGALELMLSGLFGAGIVLTLIIFLAYRVKTAYLLLIGIGIAAMMDGMMSLIVMSGDPRLKSILSWLSGTTYSSNPQTVWYLISIATILVIFSTLLIKPLQLLGLGESVARELGVKVKGYRLLLLVLVAALSTASTLAVGPLSFIGLMVPHLAVSLGAVQLEKQLPLSAILGAIIMITADWIGRYVIFPYELPAGTIASIIGGGYFLWLIWQMPVSRE